MLNGPSGASILSQRGLAELAGLADAIVTPNMFSVSKSAGTPLLH